ncbi:hypothetical protein I5M27_10905 [Adhaeribacter sp. BT258]|uniref:DUF3108 domain-containing protein n=1 Tax=Adhaeribacter terrigena TaxID=2793070 RepID=A0ABS1C268_9BACT|nr:hypothetical protein [Adhaeribacter terrigena]MBK0403496.1 hypothetical protein [Adhaeribacter terrigena]
MKRFLLLLVLVWLHSAVQAQHYQSIFGKQTTSWEIEWNNLSGTAKSTINVQRDTLVNGLLYKKIISSHFSYRGGF